MIEYLYDAIRAVAGQEIAVAAVIADDLNIPVTEGCKFVLHDETGAVLHEVDGIYIPEDEQWTFNIPASVTTGLHGRYWYSIMHEGVNMCFKQPLYLL